MALLFENSKWIPVTVGPESKTNLWLIRTDQDWPGSVCPESDRNWRYEIHRKTKNLTNCRGLRRTNTAISSAYRLHCYGSFLWGQKRDEVEILGLDTCTVFSGEVGYKSTVKSHVKNPVVAIRYLLHVDYVTAKSVTIYDIAVFGCKIWQHDEYVIGKDSREENSKSRNKYCTLLTATSSERKTEKFCRNM